METESLNINVGRWSKKEHNKLLSIILNNSNEEYINNINNNLNIFIKKKKIFPNYLDICDKLISFTPGIEQFMITRTNTQIRTHLQKIRNNIKRVLRDIKPISYEIDCTKDEIFINKQIKVIWPDGKKYDGSITKITTTHITIWYPNDLKYSKHGSIMEHSMNFLKFSQKRKVKHDRVSVKETLKKKVKKVKNLNLPIDKNYVVDLLLALSK